MRNSKDSSRAKEICWNDGVPMPVTHSLFFPQVLRVLWWFRGVNLGLGRRWSPDTWTQGHRLWLLSAVPMVMAWTKHSKVGRIPLLIANCSVIAPFPTTHPIEEEVIIGKGLSGKRNVNGLTVWRKTGNTDYLWISVICALLLLLWVHKGHCQHTFCLEILICFFS